MPNNPHQTIRSISETLAQALRVPLAKLPNDRLDASSGKYEPRTGSGVLWQLVNHLEKLHRLDLETFGENGDEEPTQEKLDAYRNHCDQTTQAYNNALELISGENIHDSVRDIAAIAAIPDNKMILGSIMPYSETVYAKSEWDATEAQRQAAQELIVRCAENAYNKNAVDFQYPEYGILPPSLSLTGDVDELALFHVTHPDLSPTFKKAIEAKIQNSFYLESVAEDLRGRERGPVFEAAVEEKENGLENVRLNAPVELFQRQSSGNGCWSCCYAMMLAGRGINVDQRSIRAFRPGIRYKQADVGLDEKSVDVTGDNMFSPLELADLTSTLLPNTAMRQVGFSFLDTPEKRSAAYAAARERIVEALKEHKSPIALRQPGHFYTIVGIGGEGGDDLVCYNPSSGTEETLKLSDVVANSQKAFSLTWLQDLTRTEEGGCLGVPELFNEEVRYRDGALLFPGIPKAGLNRRGEIFQKGDHVQVGPDEKDFFQYDESFYVPATLTPAPEHPLPKPEPKVIEKYRPIINRGAPNEAPFNAASTDPALETLSTARSAYLKNLEGILSFYADSDPALQPNDVEIVKRNFASAMVYGMLSDGILTGKMLAEGYSDPKNYLAAHDPEEAAENLMQDPAFHAWLDGKSVSELKTHVLMPETMQDKQDEFYLSAFLSIGELFDADAFENDAPERKQKAPLPPKAGKTGTPSSETAEQEKTGASPEEDAEWHVPDPMPPFRRSFLSFLKLVFTFGIKNDRRDYERRAEARREEIRSAVAHNDAVRQKKALAEQAKQKPETSPAPKEEKNEALRKEVSAKLVYDMKWNLACLTGKVTGAEIATPMSAVAGEDKAFLRGSFAAALSLNAMLLAVNDGYLEKHGIKDSQSFFEAYEKADPASQLLNGSKGFDQYFDKLTPEAFFDFSERPSLMADAAKKFTSGLSPLAPAPENGPKTAHKEEDAAEFSLFSANI